MFTVRELQEGRPFPRSNIRLQIVFTFGDVSGTRSPHVAQAGFEPMTLLSQTLSSWDLRWELLYSVEFIHIWIHFKDGKTVAFRTEAMVSFPRVAGANDHTLRKALISNYRDLFR